MISIIVAQLESGSDDVVSVVSLLNGVCAFTLAIVLSGSSIPNITPFHFSKFFVPVVPCGCGWLVGGNVVRVDEQSKNKIEPKIGETPKNETITSSRNEESNKNKHDDDDGENSTKIKKSSKR